MEIEGLVYYAERLATPHVSALLNNVCQQFTCNTHWVQTSYHPYGADRTIVAAPLDDKLWLPYVDVSAIGEATLGEYTWHVSSEIPTSQHGYVGRVRIEAIVSPTIDITNGTAAYLSEDGSMPGFLCWAEPYELADGSTCYRVRTSTGVIWLRAEDKKQSLVELLYGQAPLTGSRAQVLHLAESFSFAPKLGHDANAGLWDGFGTHDESGREWRVEHSELNFSASLRLRASGRHNEHLRTLPTTVLHPPYEAIWQPTGQFSLGVPITLTVNR